MLNFSKSKKRCSRALYRPLSVSRIVSVNEHTVGVASCQVGNGGLTERKGRKASSGVLFWYRTDQAAMRKHELARLCG